MNATEALATLDRLSAVSECRKWINGVDEETILDARATLTCASGRARGWSLVQKQRQEREERQKCL